MDDPVAVESVELANAIRSNNLVAFARLAGGAADLNLLAVPDPIPALHLAVSSRRPRMVKAVLSWEADPDVRWRGFTPLIAAVSDVDEDLKKCRPMARTLIDGGADLDARDKGGNTALIWAVREVGHPKLAVLLIDRGADPNVINGLGQTALMLAGPDEELVRRLLKAGGDPTLGAPSAWDDAVERGDEAVLKRFRRAGFGGCRRGRRLALPPLPWRF